MNCFGIFGSFRGPPLRIATIPLHSSRPVDLHVYLAVFSSIPGELFGITLLIATLSLKQSNKRLNREGLCPFKEMSGSKLPGSLLPAASW